MTFETFQDIPSYLEIQRSKIQSLNLENETSFSTRCGRDDQSGWV